MEPRVWVRALSQASWWLWLNNKQQHLQQNRSPETAFNLVENENRMIALSLTPFWNNLIKVDPLLI